MCTFFWLGDHHGRKNSIKLQEITDITLLQSQRKHWSPSFRGRTSHEGAVRSEYVRVALAVHVLGVALDAVAAVDLRQRRRHVGRRAEEVGVGERAGELHPLLVPVSPQNALDLPDEGQRGTFLCSYELQGWMFLQYKESSLSRCMLPLNVP